MLKNGKNILLVAIFSFFLMLVDQGIKYIIRQPGGFYICNPGISFGIQLPTILIGLLYLSIGLFLAYLLKKEIIRYNFLSLGLILGGAISNIIDRAKYGCVIDYIDIRIWPVFNLADAMITLGFFYILIKNLTVPNLIPRA
jgi:signal peptidase II